MLAYGVHHGFARPDLERMAMGALLMDVGMTKLPDAILTKAGQLSADEMEVMMRHPSEGVEIVRAAGFVPRETLEIIQMHHERLDGSGYPHGLQATQLPLHARLAGMLDTYDAMTSPRAFQDATPADRVLQYLLNESESTFGPTLVQQLIQCIGLYPVGSLIELDNGAVAIVVGSRPDARVRPTVLLVRTPDGDFYDKRILLNLAADPEASGPSARTVRRVLDPVYEDIDAPGIVAFEFGMAD
jgi:HD-GYP domain-containing protein (c-di-GMP phosphodiesterase class II)